MTVTFDGANLLAPTSANPDGRIFHALSRWLLWPVAATVVLVIGVSFLLSFQSQTELAISANIRPEVAWGWPIIVDGTIVIGTFAALILQPRGKRVSWYPWANLITFGILSIYANGIHATGAKPATWELFMIGAVPAVGLLVSTHMLVIMLGHTDAPAGPSKHPQPPSAEVSTPAIAVQAAAAPAQIEPTPTEVSVHAPAAKAPAPKRTAKAPINKRLTRDQAAEKISEYRAAGTPVSGDDVATWMGLSPARGRTIFEQLTSETADQEAPDA